MVARGRAGEGLTAAFGYHGPMTAPHLAAESPALSRWAFRIATTFGLADHVVAPGTLAGSLPAALLWILLVLPLRSALPAAVLTGALAVFATLAGVWAAGEEAERRGAEDPGPVVIDEVAGQWLTLLVAVPRLHLETPAGVLAAAAAGFVAFRLFDVLKPWPVRRFERLPGGLGIMADDLVAAVYAGLLVIVAAPYIF